MRSAGRGAGEGRQDGRGEGRGEELGSYGRGRINAGVHSAHRFFHARYLGAFLCAWVQVSGVARGMLRGLNAGATSTGQLRPRASWDIVAAKQNQCLLSGMASCHHFTVRFSAVQLGAAWRDIRTRVRKKGRWRVIAVNRRASL